MSKTHGVALGLLVGLFVAVAGYDAFSHQLAGKGDGAHTHEDTAVHMSGDGMVHEHSHDEPVVVLPGTPAPSVSLEIEKDAKEGWNVRILTENFVFSPENASQEHVLGEGHAHIYVDGEKLARVYSSWFHVPKLSPGEHEIAVTLNANDHRVYVDGGVEVYAAQTIIEK